MQKCEAEQNVGDEAMPMGDRPAQAGVAPLRQTDDVEEVVASHKSVGDSERQYDYQQAIEAVMGCFSGELENAGNRRAAAVVRPRSAR